MSWLVTWLPFAAKREASGDIVERRPKPEHPVADGAVLAVPRRNCLQHEAREATAKALGNRLPE